MFAQVFPKRMRPNTAQPPTAEQGKSNLHTKKEESTPNHARCYGRPEKVRSYVNIPKAPSQEKDVNQTLQLAGPQGSAEQCSYRAPPNRCYGLTCSPARVIFFRSWHEVHRA
jgi:hypothetical protein